MPLFVTQRSLYEVRERPSKAYDWKVFLIANIVVEIPYQAVLGVLVYVTYYYAVNGVQSSGRQGLVLLFCIEFLIFASTFAHMCIAALPDPQTAGSIATLLFSLMLIFNSVMQTPNALPGFWTFMYRVSPLTYWSAGIVATELHGKAVKCAPAEVSIFNPPPGQTCQQYLAPYLSKAPGQLQNPMDTTGCRYCGVRQADEFLAVSNVFYSERSRNLGLLWVYIGFNFHRRCGILLHFPGQKVEEDQLGLPVHILLPCARRELHFLQTLLDFETGRNEVST
jgi:ATP-binding cassette subfamily G (WHITE) protein 2 (PDR)